MESQPPTVTDALRRIGVILTVGLVILTAACAPRATNVQSVDGNPVSNEGNQVASWCAATSPGYRVFIVGSGSSQTMAVVADPTCRGGQR